MEMVDSADEFRKSSRSIAGQNFPNFEMLDAKVASAVKKIMQNSHFKKKVSLVEQEANKEDRFLRRRQTAFMIYDYCPVTGAMTQFQIILVNSLSLFVKTMFRNSIRDWMRSNYL